MPRSWKAILACVFLVSFLAIGAFPVQAFTTYTLNATYQIYSGGYKGEWSDFSLQYIDRDWDGWFSMDELVTFTGVTWHTTDSGNPIAYHFTNLVAVPACHPPGVGFVDSGYETYTDGPQRWTPEGSSLAIYWEFGPALSQDIPILVNLGPWNYVRSPEYTPVPLPPTVLLLGSGLLGLAGWRRFRKS